MRAMKGLLTGEQFLFRIMLVFQIYQLSWWMQEHSALENEGVASLAGANSPFLAGPERIENSMAPNFP